MEKLKHEIANYKNNCENLIKIIEKEKNIDLDRNTLVHRLWKSELMQCSPWIIEYISESQERGSGFEDTPSYTVGIIDPTSSTGKHIPQKNLKIKNIDDFITELRFTSEANKGYLIDDYLRDFSSISDSDREILTQNLSNIEDFDKLKKELVQLIEIFVG